MKNQTILMVLLLIIFGAGGFFAGTKYQQSKSPRFAGFNNGNRPTQLQQRSGTNQRIDTAFRPIDGEIISADDTSVTIKLSDGSSKIALLTDNTAFSKSSEGSKQDLKVGDKIAAFGTENSDGSVTAQNIQINPTLRNQSENRFSIN